MKKIWITFNWKGHNISKMYDKEIIFNDIKGIDDFWGDFVVDRTEFQFQIHWESNTITIFFKDGVEIIDRVNHFQLDF